MKPSFLIAGVQKGGTSALWYHLREHPEIYMPDEKELNFFNWNYHLSMAWYQRHFESSPAKRAWGEASPHYLLTAGVAARIARDLPECRLVFILRDPVERAHSNYWFNVSRGLQNPAVPFARAVEARDGQSRYVNKGYYWKWLEPFMERFSPEQMLILLAEDLKADAHATLARCYRFLGVRPLPPGPELANINVTRLPRSPLTAQLAATWMPIREAIRPCVPRPLLEFSSPLRQYLWGTLFRAGQTRPVVPPEVRERLNGIYRESNRSLGAYLGRDLSEWGQLEASPKPRVAELRKVGVC